MPSIKLLIVEDDLTSQIMLKSMLAEYRLTIVGSGEAGIEAATADQPDLIILDINLPGINGYETCTRLRSMEQTCKTPVIFLSSYTDLEDRLQAYGVGGNDYISKPFDVAELLAKMKFHSKYIEKHQQASKDLTSSHNMILELQTSAAKVQSISRFIQATLFCHDIDSLFRHFFRTAREIGVGCVLQIHSNTGVETRAIDGNIAILEQEILDMSSTMRRIHSFGKDRAIFHWSHARLLIRKVGNMIDTIALFMDALEAGIKSIEGESRLLHRVHELESQNSLVRDRVDDLFTLMNTDIKNAILSLGMVSVLDANDEDSLHDLIGSFSKRIDTELQTLGDNNNTMQQLIEELRIPPPELQELMDISADEGDGIELF
ncbi:hypothetical protein MNBD_GAMMA26-1838 [hydrothermal vent metagenome]|uniref:Response regulatory domain-containing protein n=1 Tax=hydrothermal vent metagenome TaxID=652676 RepID=A0A3B1AY65_9ZZZZ